MTPLIDIGLEATAILTIMCGIVGLLVSLGLLFWPDRIRRINASLNRHYRLKEHLAYFDKTIPNALFVYRHPMVYGALLTIGAVVTLAFLFFQLDIDRIVAILTAPGVRRLLWQMAFEVMVLSGKVAGVLGLLLGLFLMVAPDRLRRIENRLNTWIGTQALVDRLDGFNEAFDALAFRHPVLAGTVGSLLSIILILLSLSHFF